MEGLVTERTISYQSCKTSPSPTLVTVTNTDLTCEIKNNIDVIINNSLPLFLIYITQLLLITVLLYYCVLAF